MLDPILYHLAASKATGELFPIADALPRLAARVRGAVGADDDDDAPPEPELASA